MKLFTRAADQNKGHVLTNKKFQALISATIELAGNLEEIIKMSKAEVAGSPNGAQSDHIERLLERLTDASKKAKENISREDQKITGETTWDDAGYDRYIVPNATLLTVPKAAEDSMTLAVKRGATNAPLLHDLILSELTAGLARWKVALASNLDTGPN